MPLQRNWANFLAPARGETPDRVPVALIVDSPWIPGFVGMNKIDYYLYPGAY